MYCEYNLNCFKPPNIVDEVFTNVKGAKYGIDSDCPSIYCVPYKLKIITLKIR